MYRRIAESIVNQYDDDWNQDEKMREACICSVENLIANTVNILLVICSGLILGCLLEVLVYFFTFGMMRMYAGGVHARNFAECILIYLCLMYCGICGVKVFIVSAPHLLVVISIIFLVVAGIVNCKYAAQKQTVETKKQAYRRKNRRVYCIISMII